MVMLRARSIDGVLDDVIVVARALGRDEAGAAAVVALRERLFHAADFIDPYADGPSVALLESLEPLTVGGLWRAELIERAGARHLLNPSAPAPDSGAASGSQAGARRAPPPRTITPDALIASRPDVVLVCLPGLDEAHARARLAAIEREPWWRGLTAAARPRVHVLPGDALHIPGPNLFDAFEWLARALHDRPGGPTSPRA